MAAYEELNAEHSFQYPNGRGIVMSYTGFGAGVPTGCSLQYECDPFAGMFGHAPCFVEQYKDMTPHWSGATWNDNYRMPEFRAICKATPDCDAEPSCPGEYVLKPEGVLCSAGEVLKGQKECLSAYEKLHATLSFPHPNARTVHTNQGGWTSGVPAGCSLQYQGPYVEQYNDQTPHWAGDVNSTNARVPEFRAICCQAESIDSPTLPPIVTTIAPTDGCAIKDGFLKVACLKDYMYYHGDKFGDNRYDYKIGPVSNDSIVHYEAHVAKEDRHAITPEVCFEYCRALPDMGFFGIVNGRGCYCTPYFKPMASDSSMCDSICEGDHAMFCGGKSKSTVFAMHCCASTKGELLTETNKAHNMQAGLDHDAELANILSHDVQDCGDVLQKSFGAVGDSGAASHAQAAKVFAGTLVHTAEAAVKISSKLAELSKDASALLLTDLADLEQLRKGERLLESFAATIAEGKAASDELAKVLALARSAETNFNASKQYYPVMYFVDKEFTDVPSTCAGDMVGEPVQGGEDACATKCDENIHSCVGYQFYEYHPLFDSGVCVLLSKFRSAVYYTGCDPSTNSSLQALFSAQISGPSTGFLQTHRQTPAPYEAKCVAKLSEFVGTTLKPDGSGKCKNCLRELTKADRCY
jgi:hypothetical protein